MQGADVGCLRGQKVSLQNSVEIRFGFGLQDVPVGLQQTAAVEPADPFQRGLFFGLDAGPSALEMNDLGLEQAIDHLGVGVLITVSDAAP